MPELPEMENYKRQLWQLIGNKSIRSIEVDREKSINVPVLAFQQALLQERILFIERRAKHLLFHLSSGKVLLLHLMLGGLMYYGTKQDKPNRSIQVTLSYGTDELYFIGLRLGYLHLLTHAQASKALSDLGPEPFSPAFTLELFSKLANNKRGMIKSALIDQSFISGIGNCYADEICFRAELHPASKWTELNADDIARLYDAIRTVLQEATDLGGYMELPLFEEDQLTGGYNDHCKVYDQEDKPCFRCGNPIIKEMIASRKTFYCGHCQSSTQEG
jgi:formamidopyrimidine-DNA glycosylase